MIESVPLILLMDWQLMENPIPTLFLGYKSKEKNSRRTLFRKSLKKNAREGDITPVTSTSQEEEVPLQANYYDRSLSHD